MTESLELRIAEAVALHPTSAEVELLIGEVETTTAEIEESTIGRGGNRNVWCAKTPDSCTAEKCCYSIISSARPSSIGGTSMPSAFAVPRLMTSSNLVARSTGISAGLEPFKIRPA